MGICCLAQIVQTGALYQLRGVGWGGDGREGQKEGNLCIPMADSCRGLTENRKILQSNYPSIKNNFKRECY